MRPSPKVAMSVSTIVPLHSEPQSVPRKTPAIEHDLPGKKCIGMRCAGESNPTFVAERDVKPGTPAQLPRNRVPSNVERSAAEILANLVLAAAKVKWIVPAGAEIQALQRKSLNEALRLSLPWKPRGPHLYGQPARVARATAPSRIHQQISEPPRPAAIRQSHTNKPDFVTPAGRERGIDFVQRLHKLIMRANESDCSHRNA